MGQLVFAGGRDGVPQIPTILCKECSKTWSTPKVYFVIHLFEALNSLKVLRIETKTRMWLMMMLRMMMMPQRMLIVELI